MDVRDAPLWPKGYQQLTVSTAAVALTIPSGARYALLKLDSANLARWRDDGTDPTATVGMPMDQADEFWYTGKLASLLFFEDNAGAILNVSYYS